MNKYQRLGLVAGQIFVGLGFALGGGILGILVDDLRSLINGMMTDLYGSVLTALIFSYIGLFIGISFDGYRILKRLGRQTEFGKFCLQSIGGFVVGLLIYSIIAISSSGSKFPHTLINSLAIVLPLLGTILGFDFRLDKTEKGTSDQ